MTVVNVSNVLLCVTYQLNVPYLCMSHEYHVCIAVLTLDAGLLAWSQYPERPATGHLDTGSSWFPCVFKRMLSWFSSLQVVTTCFSCSPPDLNSLVTFFPYSCTCKITTATGWEPNCSLWLLLLLFHRLKRLNAVYTHINNFIQTGRTYADIKL